MMSSDLKNLFLSAFQNRYPEECAYPGALKRLTAARLRPAEVKMVLCFLQNLSIRPHLFKPNEKPNQFCHGSLC